MKKRLNISLIAIIYFLFYSTYSYAVCIQSSEYKNIQVNVPNATYTVLYDDMSQKELGKLSVTYLGKPTYSSTENSLGCGDAYLYGKFINNWVEVNYIAESNISGVGIMVSGPARQKGYHFDITYILPGTIRPYIMNYNTWDIQIIKTGQIKKSGTIRSGPIAQVTQKNSTLSYPWYLTTLNMPENAIRINVLSCSLKNNQSTYNINMGDKFDTEFKTIGDTTEPVDIPINLTCAAGTNIKTTVTSSGGYIDAATGKLALTGAGKATGVAIQLIDKNNEPIPLNQKNSVQDNIPEGDYILGWKARYIKTADTITTGTANASAIVNIRYE